MPIIAETLGAFAAGLKYENLPSDVVHSAKRMLMDTLGCAFGGYNSEPSRIACDLASTGSSTQPATVLCSGQITSAELACFANGVMIRYLDFNDGYVSKGGGHPSDTIAPLLAAAEAVRASGRDLILATVLAYEVFCRICDAWSSKSRGIDGVTVVGMGSVVGVAKLMGLTQQQIVEAINIMVASSVALNQTRLGNVSNWKSCAAGHIARNAIIAPQLAVRGMTGPSPVFEGKAGVFTVLSGEPFELAPLGDADPPFRILRCHLKRFPLGNYSQTVVTAALDARKLAGNVRDISEVRIGTSQKAIDGMAGDPEKWSPKTRETADHSMPYVAAVALKFGTIDESYFEQRYFLHDKELLDLVGKVKCYVSEESERRSAETYVCEFEVILRSGGRKAVKIEYHRGHWRNPMADDEVEEKFGKLARKVLPAARVEALASRLWSLDELSSVQALCAMTAAKPRRWVGRALKANYISKTVEP